MTLRKITALLLALCMVLSLAACGGDPIPSTTPTTTEPTSEPTTEPEPTEPDPAELYAAAVEQLLAVTDMALTIQSTRTLDIGGEVFTEKSNVSLDYTGYGTDALTASAAESTTIGSYVTKYEEDFSEGILYVGIDGTSFFQGAVSAEDYTARFAPPVMLDAALYSDITLDGSTVCFSGASAGESWLVPEYAELVEASGTAALSADNTLTGYTYSATYAVGGARITWEVQSTIEAEPETIHTYRTQDVEYVELEYVDAPRIIEQAAGYLYCVTDGHAVTTSTAESITSYAAGVIRNQSTTINTWGSGSDYMADVDLSIYLMTADSSDSYDQVEHYQDGVYTLSENDGAPVEYSGVTASNFKSYCLSALVANIPGLDLLTGATAEDLGSVYYLELAFDLELGQAMNESICNILWGDGAFLDDLSDSYRTESMEVYFAIDKCTGLPTAVGHYYEGYHTIDGYEYMLSLQTDQSFDLASQSAYETITEEAPPAQEPEEKATPLFYHVTGPNGEEMWLLGTIHVGDERTSYLPQVIYDAFDAADALAVEFNSEAFNEELDENEELSDQVSESYFYDDGTLADHIEDQELYEYAEKLMKATGNYHMNAPYMKAYLWSSSIDNFYLRQGYGISSTQGVDNQLIWRAQEMDKTILDVESGLFQIQMLTGFSDPLQEMLLLESCSTDALEYVNSTTELFEMWCAGDEAALIEYINDDDDTSELTEEEQKLLDEYNNAMGSDRNDDMLTVAIGYLESGDVVFFAVGLAHLLAEDGLVNTLRDAGYTVELVTYG